jgi:hypothetical protein
MGAKVTTVKLVVPQYGMEQEFEAAHAERLLAMRNNGGWQLPQDSKFVFSNGKLDRK